MKLMCSTHVVCRIEYDHDDKWWGKNYLLTLFFTLLWKEIYSRKTKHPMIIQRSTMIPQRNTLNHYCVRMSITSAADELPEGFSQTLLREEQKRRPQFDASLQALPTTTGPGPRSQAQSAGAAVSCDQWVHKVYALWQPL